MGEIYSAAYEVHAWLGPTSVGSDEAMCFIRNPSGGSMTPAKKRHLHALLNSDYRTRPWIGREIILGGAFKTQIHCGSETITSAQMHDVFNPFGWDAGLPSTAHHLISSSDYIAAQRVSAFKSDKVDLDWLDIYHFLQHKCSNILDKIYGLQGLLNPKHHVPVAYNISVDKVFSDRSACCFLPM
jgi:hypothetical protein